MQKYSKTIQEYIDSCKLSPFYYLYGFGNVKN